MAGYRDSDFIRRACIGHRTHGIWLANAPSNFAVGRSRSHRYLAQLLPDALLESGAAHVERQVETVRGCLDETHNPCNKLLKILVAADQPCVGKAILKNAH